MPGIILTFNYYQAPRIVYKVTGGLQILVFRISALAADFDTQLKRWIKSNCSAPALHFLASSLKLKYFFCSNLVERRVFTTHSFLTDRTHQLHTTGFELSRFVEIEHDRPRDKVIVTPAWPEHTLFTIEGVETRIFVETGPRPNEQKEILEYVANNPAACFVKEVEGFCWKYCPIEEYPQILNSNDVYMCRFLAPAPELSDERDIDLFAWVGSGNVSRYCKLFLGRYMECTGVYSPAESTRLVQRHLYIKYGYWGFALKLSWCRRPVSGGIILF